MKRIAILLFFLLSTRGVFAQQVVPTPRHIEVQEGRFILTGNCLISPLTDEAQEVADYLSEFLPLEQRSYLDLGSALVLDINPSLPDEGYRLRVGEQRIEVTGGSRNGLFYGVQTLLQLLPAEVYSRKLALPCEVDCCLIEDAPAYTYRGSHLDVARTWMPLERVKQHIDRMAFHKLNTLHLHLTDDEGWRIEILSHPELTEVGGFRGGDSPIEPVYGRWFEKYGGYFTQEELRELVEYARLRAVEIIPEIDLPGHSRTFARVHPEILCDYTPSLDRSAGYDVRNAFCASREENFELLEEVLTEVCALFPSKYIHIGGDEVEMSQWKRCPRCQRLMQEQRWEDPARLQEYFMSRLITILKSNNKEPVVWNEAINGGTLEKSALVQGWESVKACRKSTSEGYRTVVMPGQYFYFDMRQSQHEEGHVWAAIFDAQKVYNFSLDALGFTPEEQRLVVGFEGTFFSEAYIGHNPESDSYLDFMLWPRTVALAEICWHRGPKDWASFRHTLTHRHAERMDAMSIGHRLFPPSVKYSEGLLSAKADQPDQRLVYTLDPDTTEHPYTGPIRTSEPELYRFRALREEARSAWVAHASYYKTIQPAVHFSCSLPESEKAPFNRIDSYKGAAWTTRTHRTGDWLRYDFAEPLSCREIHLQTGYLHLPRCTFRQATVEVSRDGSTFEPAGELTAGAITLRPQFPIRSIRVTATSTGNGEERVIIQSLKIKK